MYVFLITIIVIFSICVVLYPILFSNEINKNEYNRELLNNSFNFFKIKINKKSKINIECKKDESILKTFYIVFKYKGD